jgi:hypothetical protein
MKTSNLTEDINKMTDYMIFLQKLTAAEAIRVIYFKRCRHVEYRK